MPRKKKYAKKNSTALSKRVSQLESKLAAQGHYTTDDFTFTSPDLAGQSVLINGIAQGDSAGDREGSKVYCKNLSYNMVIKNLLTSITTVRVLVFVHRLPNGSIWDLTEILANQTGVANDVYQLRELDYFKHYKVIKDQMYTLPPAGTNQRNFIQIRDSVKLNMLSEYTGSGAATSNLLKNAVYLLVMSDVSTGAGTKPEVQGGYQMTFNP